MFSLERVLTTTTLPLPTPTYLFLFISGEKFEIELDAVAHGVASGEPVSTVQIIAPQPVTDIEPVLDAENITLQWPRPDGRIGEL